MESAAAFTYVIQEPFDQALTSIREALVKEHLRVPMELDVAARIKRELGFSLAPCWLLFVGCRLLAARGCDTRPHGCCPVPPARRRLGSRAADQCPRDRSVGRVERGSVQSFG